MLDAFLAELNRCFSKKIIELMHSISSLCPIRPHFFNPLSLKPLANMYDLDYDLLFMESTLATHTLVNTEMETLNDVFHELWPLKSAFPTLVKAIQIALTICVSTAECERSFSSLKRIKSYLRSTMTEQCFTDLAILSIEKELSIDLSFDDVIDKFGSSDKIEKLFCHEY